MLLKGLQKLTLLDYPGVVACTVFTGGCNLRCPFCQNASLVTHLDEEQIDEEEFFEFLKERVGLLDAVCVSGGEPCLQKDLKEFIQKIKKLGFLVKLDTNGTKPEVLKDLIENELLDYVAMDIKNKKEKYSITSGVEVPLTEIEKSISILKTSGIPHEFRTTVVKDFHTKKDLLEIASWVAPSKLFLQQFQDSGDLIQEGLSAHEISFMEEMEKDLNKITEVHTRGIK